MYWMMYYVFGIGKVQSGTRRYTNAAAFRASWLFVVSLGFWRESTVESLKISTL